jgi:CheY-like chemotaxis protein
MPGRVAETVAVSARVAIADYNKQFRSSVAAGLQELGLDVIEIGSSDQLVNLIESDPPELLIWDVRMEMDTFKRLDQWRPTSVTAQLPRISIGVTTADAFRNGWLERMPGPVPLLMGRQPMTAETVVEAAVEVLSELAEVGECTRL